MRHAFSQFLHTVLQVILYVSLMIIPPAVSKVVVPAKQPGRVIIQNDKAPVIKWFWSGSIPLSPISSSGIRNPFADPEGS